MGIWLVLAVQRALVGVASAVARRAERTSDDRKEADGAGFAIACFAVPSVFRNKRASQEAL
jgi:hypothetical protein